MMYAMGIARDVIGAIVGHGRMTAAGRAHVDPSTISSPI